MRNTLRNRKSTQGFTLIELLIVIAIIGILAAVLIPNLIRARGTAQERALQAHSSTVNTTATAWLTSDPVRTAAQAVTAYNGCTIPKGAAADGYVTNAAPSNATGCVVTEANGGVSVAVTGTGAGGTAVTYTNGVKNP